MLTRHTPANTNFNREVPIMTWRPFLYFAAFAALTTLDSSAVADSRDPRRTGLTLQALSETPPPPPAVANVDSVVLARFDFDDAQGGADAQGWTVHDLTAGQGSYWHVDDFSGLAGYTPLAGSRSMWCGQRTAPDGVPGGSWPGYGNLWYQFFESVAFAVSGDVTLSFTADWDIENAYDYCYVDYSVSDGSWTTLTNLTGQGAGLVSVIVPDIEHAGSLRLRLRVQSDNAWSDADGLWDTQGAIVIDNLLVQDAGGIVDQQDFESDPVGSGTTADGDWVARGPTPFGSYGGLVSGPDVSQLNLATFNATNFWGFFIGSPDDYECGGRPEQLAVPYTRLAGGYAGDYIANEARSPWLRLDQDEYGQPLGAVPDTVSVQFRAYLELPAEGEVFYQVRCRFRGPVGTTEWDDLNLVYYGAQQSWVGVQRLFAVPPGSQEMQVGLDVVDLDWAFNLGGAKCHSHTPLFDDVRVVATTDYAGGFVNVAANLPTAAYGDVDWGDYDGDGDLDMLLVGRDAGGPSSRVMRNDAGVFVDAGAPLANISFASGAWGDYDNDGDPDILIAGDPGASPAAAATRLYRNDAGAFTPVATAMTDLICGYGDRGLDWGDYDNDGDLDVLIQGRQLTGSPGPVVCLIHRNDGGGVFTPVVSLTPAVQSGTVAWGDYDGDGDLDLAYTGTPSSGVGLARICRNDGADQFTDIGAMLPPLLDGGLAWGDFDRDGDLDLALTGAGPANTRVSVIYINDDGIFLNLWANLVPLSGGSADWGDVNGDGDLDLLLTGYDGAVRRAIVYSNDAGVFTDRGAVLTGSIYGSSGWGDYDNDGRLDLLLAGWNPTDSYFTRLFRNTGTAPNQPPTAPSGLTATVQDGVVTLGWSAAVDGPSAPAGLTYNVRVGTTSGGQEVCTAMAESATGFRRVARPGNAGHRLEKTLTLPPGSGPFYWSVQAVDASFAGGPFAAEQAFVAGPVGYVDLGSGLTGMTDPAVAWADHDGDGDQDLILTGLQAGVPVTIVYRNDGGGVFTPLNGGKSGAGIAAALPGVSHAAVAWGDYDNDGDVDLWLSGLGVPATPTGGLYRNDGGALTAVAPGLAAVARGAAAWGDLDNDGDLDLLLTGTTTAATHDTRLYRNDGAGQFTELAGGLPATRDGSAAWADSDNDGDLDLLIGGDGPSGALARLYVNDGQGQFTDAAAGLPALGAGRLAWGDADNDGDPDVLLAGDTVEYGLTGRVYRNDGGNVFTDLGSGSPGMAGRDAAWGDVDGDGDLDILLVGGPPPTPYACDVYLNDGGAQFTRATDNPLAGIAGTAAFGDHDQDGDQDLVLVGWNGASAVAMVYANLGAGGNQPPSAPTALQQSQGAGRLTLSWNAAADAQTPAPGLTYNLRIGTTPGGSQVMSAQAAADGLRLATGRGNAQQRLSWSIDLPAAWSQLYCGVQAIDAAGAGSPFSTELVVTPGWVAAAPVPSTYVLHANAPNPFNPATRLSFELPIPEVVRLGVFDAQGRRVRSLLDESREAGRHELEWDGRDDGGRAVASGVYLCRMEAGEFRRTIRMTLIR
jgi:hypothetical protein